MSAGIHVNQPRHSVLSLIGALFVMWGSGVAAGGETAFPPATPESQGVSSAAISRLAALAQQLVDDEDVVGAELLVVKNRKTILHGAYGWKDRENRLPMQTDSIFCVRSMTKPAVATAVLMLIDEGRLRLDTPVREVLPAFDHSGTRDITIEQLLTHTSGLPLTTIARPLREYGGIQGIADEAGRRGPEFEPGSKFQYATRGATCSGPWSSASAACRWSDSSGRECSIRSE